MKLAYKNMECVIRFDGGYVNELTVENRKMFFEMANSLSLQSEGLQGDFALYINGASADFGKNADVTVQFAPFGLNRKSLLTKLYAFLERTALAAENFAQTSELLTSAEKYINELAEDMPFEINCQKVSAGALIRAFAPEFEEDDSTPLEKIFSYMELVRELDKDRLFVMVNMRSYFSDEDMEEFARSVCLHDFKVLLLESVSRERLKNVKRYTIDEDLCEF